MSSENNKKVCDLFLMGRSTTEIGVICGFSRQRAHQILKSNGLSRNDGGVCRRKLNNKTKASLRRGNSINTAFGITYKRWRFYRSMDNDYFNTPLIKYKEQKQHSKDRGINWLLNMDEWWCIWQESGKWLKRGCCLGEYVMARYGDQGAYSISNVYITTASDNHLSYHYGTYPKKLA